MTCANCDWLIFERTYLKIRWVCLNLLHALHKKCPYLELFWSVFFRIRAEYGEIRSILRWKYFKKSKDKCVYWIEEVQNIRLYCENKNLHYVYMHMFLHKQPLRSFISKVYLVLYFESRLTKSKSISPIPPTPKNGLVGHMNSTNRLWK